MIQVVLIRVPLLSDGPSGARGRGLGGGSGSPEGAWKLPHVPGLRVLPCPHPLYRLPPLPHQDTEHCMNSGLQMGIISEFWSTANSGCFTNCPSLPCGGQSRARAVTDAGGRPPSGALRACGQVPPCLRGSRPRAGAQERWLGPGPREGKRWMGWGSSQIEGPLGGPPLPWWDRARPTCVSLAPGAMETGL